MSCVTWTYASPPHLTETAIRNQFDKVAGNYLGPCGRGAARRSELSGEWQRLAPAREFAATLLRYRAEQKLSQRALAEKLGVSQPRVVKLESGEHNPEIDTIINAVRRLGIEFVLDVAPAGRKPALVTARAQKRGAIAHDDVSVVAASSV